MASWSTTTKHEPTEINGGQKYELGDQVSLEQLNAITENGFNSANKDLSNVTYPEIVYDTYTGEFDGLVHTGAGDRVIESKIYSDGRTWYRIWESGWKECGLILSDGSWGAKTKQLPISFLSINYICNITPILDNSKTGTYSTREISVNAKTESSITLWWDGILIKQVYCCGY